MSTINYIKICKSQRVDSLQRAEETSFYMKRKSAETLAAEAAEHNYTKRSNICTSCYVARSASGSCNC